MRTRGQWAKHFVDVIYGGPPEWDWTGSTEGKVQQRTRKSVNNRVSTKIWAESAGF